MSTFSFIMKLGDCYLQKEKKGMETKEHAANVF